MKLYESRASSIDNDTLSRIAKLCPTKEQIFWRNLRSYVREYADYADIPGVRCVIGDKRPRTEKIVWAVIMVFLFCMFLLVFCQICIKYNNSPVVVNFATEETPLFKIPFPAITVCPEAKYSRREFNYTKVYFQLEDNEEVDEDELEKFYHLSLLCDDEEKVTSRASKIVDHGFFDTLDQLKLDRESIFQFCFLYNEIYNCEDLFTPILIDQGICYSFNILDRQEIFQKHVFNYAGYYQAKNLSHGRFDIETGYRQNAGINTYPRRALMSGADNSLTIFFNYDTSDTDFICNNVFQGFRVLIHNPWDVPRLSNRYFRIPFGKLVVATMEPEAIATSDSVKSFNPDKRKCFMKDERPLKHFKHYSQPNCLLECLTNFTYNKCGCVNFFMPRGNRTAICGSGRTDCLEQAASEFKQKEVESKISGQSFCDCRPSCNNLKFSVETSHSDFYFKEYFEAHTKLRVKDDGSHWSVLQIYFKDEQFMTMERHELYRASDLISQIGGILGLFTGFSFVSIAEVLYFCSLRLYYNHRMYGLWAGPPN